MLGSMVCKMGGHRVNRRHVWDDGMNFRTNCARCDAALIRDREGCGIVHGPSQRDVLCVLSRRVDPVREQHDEQVQVGVDPD